MPGTRSSIIFAFIAVLSLTGAECVFVAKSGSSSKTDDREDEQTSNLVVIIRNGRFIDAPVEGLAYRSGTLSGFTGPDGEFQYEAGRTVRFSIGDLELGRAVAGKAVITPLDLVPDGSVDSTAVINIARLLQSLDSVPGDDRITVPAAVSAAAVRSNEALYAAITHLDFGDDVVFTNAAAQLVATLTSGYPFTAALVDAPQARTHLLRSLAAAGTEAATVDRPLD
ncbi:MAG: hypothetical protein PVG38_11710 [Gammaproteobacteria bacterium]|jgi:hypothetical protein